MPTHVVPVPNAGLPASLVNPFLVPIKLELGASSRTTFLNFTRMRSCRMNRKESEENENDEGKYEGYGIVAEGAALGDGGWLYSVLILASPPSFRQNGPPGCLPLPRPQLACCTIIPPFFSSGPRLAYILAEYLGLLPRAMCKLWTLQPSSHCLIYIHSAGRTT
jgi:hypothetical protein